MKKTKFKKLAGILMGGVLSIGLVGSIYATSSSSSTSKTVYGYTYTYYADISASQTGVRAGTYIGTNKSLPAGYMGAIGMIYADDGTLHAKSAWDYNDSSTLGMNIPAYAEKYEYGKYYSYGKVKMYNGSDYVTEFTKKSPIVIYDSTTKSVSELSDLDSVSIDEIIQYEVNDNGETYGSGICEPVLGIQLDLIRAYGTNGEIGYVKSTDLETDEYDSPEECLANQSKEDIIIPLYDVDGETIIGDFCIRFIEAEEIN